THLDHVAVLAGRSVVTVVTGTLLDLVQHHGGFVAGVGDDLAQRSFDGATQDVDTGVLLFVDTLQVNDGCQGANQGHTAARHHAFVNACTGCVQGVFDASLLLFHFDFGGRTDLDHRNTASQLGQTLLQFFLVVVGRGVFDLLADLQHARFDVGLSAGTVDDGGVVLGQNHALGVTQVLQGGAFQAQADFFADPGTAREDRNVLQHGRAAIAAARRINGSPLHDAAQVVDHQGSQDSAFHAFGHDHP